MEQYQRENKIEKYLNEQVKAAGGITYKLAKTGRRGAPDRLVMLPGGRVVFVECKAPGEKPRPSQTREHERLKTLGFNVVVLDSKNLTGVL